MNSIPIDFTFTDANGRDHVLRAVTLDGREWHLHAALDGRTFTRRCTDWQRVERTLRWLRAHAHEPAATPAASSGGATSVRTLVASALIAAAALVAPAASAQERWPWTDGVTQFLQAADAYTLMHRRLERQLPPLAMNANPATVSLAIDTMAAAIRAERRDAAPGDLFNPAVRATIRTRIGEALRAHDLTAADVLAAERDAGIDTGAADLHVNGTFPWALSSRMFSCVLAVLPPLPPELQYRMIGRDLVLIDVHASLIVDILPFALGADDTLSGSGIGGAP